MANISFKSSNIILAPDLEEYITKKLNSFDKFLRPENNIRVELDAETKHHSGLRCHVEVLVMPQPGIIAEARGSDLFEAFDLCMPKLKEQLVKNKDKQVSMRRKLGSKRKNGE